MTITLPFNDLVLCWIITIVFLGWTFLGPSKDGMAGMGPAFIRIAVTAFVIALTWIIFLVTR